VASRRSSPLSARSLRAGGIPIVLAIPVVLAALSALAAWPAIASDPAAAGKSTGPPRFWPGVVDTVEVAAPRPQPLDSPARRTGFSTYIPLGPEAPADRDLSDLLDRTAGVHVHRYGGLGAFALASIRGSAPGQVLVCLDGVPVASAGDGLVNLALLPASSLEHAEVFRGPQTASFGGPPSAGVINLVSPESPSVPLRLSAGAGSFGTATAGGQWGGARDGVGGLLSAQYRRSRGNFSYLDRNGTLFRNTSDDRIVRRANNDFEDASLLWKTFAQTPGRSRAAPGPAARVEYVGQRFARAGGVPGTENIQTRHVRFRTERTRHEAIVNASIGGPAVEAAAHWESIRDRFDNRDGEVGLGRVETDNRTRELGGRVAASYWPPLLGQALRVGWETRDERWTPRDRLLGERGYTRSRRHLTTSVEDRLAVGRLTLEGAYRWARARDNYAGPTGLDPNGPPEPSPARTLRHQSPTLGVGVDLGRGLRARVNHGRIARFPSFPELFGQNGIQEGNPALRPEQGVQWDAGLSCAPAAPVRIEGAYFESLVEDRISLIQNSQRTAKAQNLDRSWVRGLEWSFFAACGLPGRFDLETQATQTWQEARDLGRNPAYRGKELPNLPRSEGYLSNRLSRGPWKLRWEISARSGSYRDRYNTREKRTPAYTLHDLSLERRLGRGAWRLRGEVRNVGDVRVEDIDGFPLPGRAVMTEVTWTR
jgi:iron complex outermembrane receptor protein